MTDKRRVIETWVLCWAAREYVTYSDHFNVPGQPIELSYSLINSYRFAYQFVSKEEACNVKGSLLKYHRWASALEVKRWLIVEEVA